MTRNGDFTLDKIWKLFRPITSTDGLRVRSEADGGTSNLVVRFDAASVDVFNRLQVAEPFTIFDSKQIVADINNLYYDTQTLSGAGTTATFNTNEASTTLAITALTAGHIAKQSKRWFNYQPGKAQIITLTHTFGTSQSGVIKRRGLFETNNGLFWQLDNDGLKVAQRSYVSGAPVDTAILQGNFNVDNLDGTGPSGFTLDTTNSAIYFISFEWLGVGDTVFGVFNNRFPIIAHVFRNTNAITSVYMSTPNLPIRTEIIADGANAAGDEIDEICTTVISSGGVQRTGQVRAVDRGTTAFTTVNSTAIQPLLSIRLKSTHLGATIHPLHASIIQLGSNAEAYRWVLLMNPTVGGVDAASWQNVTDSSIQYDITRNNTNVLTGGYILDSGYVPGDTNQGKQTTDISLDSELLPGSDLQGDPDEIVLGIQYIANPGTPVPTVYASLTYSDVI